MEGLSALQTHWVQQGWCLINSAFAPEYIAALQQALPTELPDTQPSETQHIIIEKLWDPFNDYTPLWTWLNSDGLTWMSRITAQSLASPKRHSLRIQRVHGEILMGDKAPHRVRLFLGLSEKESRLRLRNTAASSIELSMRANQLLLLDPQRVHSLLCLPTIDSEASSFMVTAWLETTAL